MADREMRELVKHVNARDREITSALREITRWENARRSKESQAESDRIMEGVAKLNAHYFERASAFTNIVIVVGYAGFFTSWHSLGSLGFPRWHAAAAMFVLVSAMGFACWEVFKMVIVGIYFRRVVPLLDADPTEVGVNLDRIKAAQDSISLWMSKLWLPVVGAVLGTGLIGMVILITLLAIFVVTGIESGPATTPGPGDATSLESQ